MRCLYPAAAEPWAAMYRPLVRSNARHFSNQFIVQPLRVAFHVIMLHEVRHCTTQRRLPNNNHPIQAFFFERAYEAPGICIQIGGATW